MGTKTRNGSKTVSTETRTGSKTVVTEIGNGSTTGDTEIWNGFLTGDTETWSGIKIGDTETRAGRKTGGGGVHQDLTFRLLTSSSSVCLFTSVDQKGRLIISGLHWSDNGLHWPDNQWSEQEAKANTFRAVLRFMSKYFQFKPWKSVLFWKIQLDDVLFITLKI